MIRHHYQRQLKDERAYFDLQIQEAESRLWEEDSGNRKLNAYILITSTKHKRENKNVIRLLISNPPMVTYFLQGVQTTETSPKMLLMGYQVSKCHDYRKGNIPPLNHHRYRF